MDVVNLRQLKSNPSEALRAVTQGPVLVLKGDRPEPLLVRLDLDRLPEPSEVLLALAASLFRNGAVSLGRAARIGGVPVSDSITQVSRLGLERVGGQGWLRILFGVVGLPEALGEELGPEGGLEIPLRNALASGAPTAGSPRR